MLNCFFDSLVDISECDLLTLNTLITKEIMQRIKDADTLNMVGDLLSSVGANLNMISNQRQYIETAKNNSDKN